MQRSWSFWGAAGAVAAGAVSAIVAGALALTAPPAPSPAPVLVPSSPVAGPGDISTGVPPRPAAVRIMPLGDSITAGIGTATLDSYRRDLYDRLVAAGVDVDLVGSANAGSGADGDHEGHSGWTIARLAAHVDPWLRTYRPDVILLHIGTNDMRTDAAAREAPGRLTRLIERIRAHAPRAQLLVAELIGARQPRNQRRIDAYNRQVPGIVRAHPGVRLVDQSSVDDVSLRDNLHPNDYGAAQMAWNWYRALEPVLNRSGRAWPAGVDPYLARRAYLCALEPSFPHGSYVGVVECNWWHRTRPRSPWIKG